MWIEEREQIATTQTPPEGAFGWTSLNTPAVTDGAINVNVWESCRERFLAQQPGRRFYYFKHNLPLGRGKSIAMFFDKIEKKLGIKTGRRTSIQATSKKKIVKVMPARFWDQSDIRRSLFSALLRASVNYRYTSNEGRGNLEDAIYSNAPGNYDNYLRDTRRAVERFLDKKATHYWGKVLVVGAIGWYTVFRNKTNAEIGRMLRKTRKLKHPKPKVITVMVYPDTNPGVAA